jgi:hypothetical protein
MAAAILTFVAPFAARAATPDDSWRFEIGSYLWATSINGHTGSDDHIATVDADFAEVIRDIDRLSGLTLHTEVGKGPVSVFLDGNYLKIGKDGIRERFGLVDATSTTIYLEAGGAYRLIDEQPIGTDGSMRFTLEPIAGARMTTMKTQLAIPGNGNDFDERNTWIDPFVGARARVALGEHWGVSLRGDVGGFGAGSQFSWNAVALVGYQFHIGRVPTIAYFGYHALGQDFVTSGFVWDTVVHGPVIGLNFSF